MEMIGFQIIGLLEVNKVITESHPDVVEYNAFKSIDGKNVEMKTSHFRGFFGEKEVKEKIVPCMLCDRNQRFYTFGVLPAVWSKMIKTEILRDSLCSRTRLLLVKMSHVYTIAY